MATTRNDKAKEKSPFRLRREELGYSREKAAELIDGMTVERLERIENGKLDVRPDEILVMSRTYRKPELANHYCSHLCAIGRSYVPEVVVDDLPRVTLRMVASIESLKKCKKRLVEIAADGIIDETEVADFLGLQEKLEELSVAIESLQLWTEQMVADGIIDETAYNREKAKWQKQADSA
jgi:hypothetical protein